MDKVILGKTGLEVSKNGFGALPIQRITKKEAVYLLQKAFYNGINYFDTARAYSDSEEKIGAAFEYTREKIIISTKTMAQTAEGFWKDLEESLTKMKTDYIDIYQFHNPAFCPKPGDESGLYDAALEAKKQGKIRHIGITNHRIAVAEEASHRVRPVRDAPVPVLLSGSGCGSEDCGKMQRGGYGIHCHERTLRRADPQFSRCICIYGTAAVRPCGADLGSTEGV